MTHEAAVAAENVIRREDGTTLRAVVGRRRFDRHSDLAEFFLGFVAGFFLRFSLRFSLGFSLGFFLRFFLGFLLAVFYLL